MGSLSVPTWLLCPAVFFGPGPGLHTTLKLLACMYWRLLYNPDFIKKPSKDNMLRKSRNCIAAPGLCLALLLSVVLTGCGAPQELSPKEISQLEQRVRERWEARSAHDFGKEWEYSTPNYRRSFPKSLYIHKFSYALNWELTGLEVLNYDAGAAVASVAVRVMSEPTKLTSTASRAVGAVPLTIHEKWIRMDGEWWYSANY